MITASIVTFNTDFQEIFTLLECIENSIIDKVYIIDNSPENSLRELTNLSAKVFYFFNGANLGYGSGHNIAIKRFCTRSKYHLVLNTDISFAAGTIEQMVDFMDSHEDVGQLMPLVLYKDGAIQKLCKLLPTPLDLAGRFIFRKYKFFRKANDRYELLGFNYDKIINTPCLSGCFMLFRNDVLQSVEGFDPRYFMYLEDYDLTRRVHKIAKTCFYPNVHVIHGFKKGSYSNPVLLRYHVLSMIKYFNKWGWFRDEERDSLNRKVLDQIPAKKTTCGTA